MNWWLGPMKNVIIIVRKWIQRLEDHICSWYDKKFIVKIYLLSLMRKGYKIRVSFMDWSWKIGWMKHLECFSSACFACGIVYCLHPLFETQSASSFDPITSPVSPWRSSSTPIQFRCSSRAIDSSPVLWDSNFPNWQDHFFSYHQIQSNS